MSTTRASGRDLIEAKRAAEIAAVKAYGPGAVVFSHCGADARSGTKVVFDHVGAKSADGSRVIEIPNPPGDHELTRHAEGLRLLVVELEKVQG
jgi:hypothetical protein